MRVHVTLVLLLWLAGCASTPPDRNYYLLRYVVPSGVVVSPTQGAVGLARVTVAGYLAQPGIVVETAPNEVRSAHDHLWVEPLSEGLTLYLRAAIEAALGRTVQVRVGEALAAGPSVRVFIEELHGTMTGEARIVARFQVSSGAGAVPRDVHFARAVPLPRAGYAALVEAERALLDQLAIAIGQEMP